MIKLADVTLIEGVKVGTNSNGSTTYASRVFATSGRSSDYSIRNEITVDGTIDNAENIVLTYMFYNKDMEFVYSEVMTFTGAMLTTNKPNVNEFQVVNSSEIDFFKISVMVDNAAGSDLVLKIGAIVIDYTEPIKTFELVSEKPAVCVMQGTPVDLTTSAGNDIFIELQLVDGTGANIMKEEKVTVTMLSGGVPTALDSAMAVVVGEVLDAITSNQKAVLLSDATGLVKLRLNHSVVATFNLVADLGCSGIDRSSDIIWT